MTDIDKDLIIAELKSENMRLRADYHDILISLTTLDEAKRRYNSAATKMEIVADEFRNFIIEYKENLSIEGK